MRHLKIAVLGLISTLFLLTNCKKDEVVVTTGKLKGMVTDIETTLGLKDVRIIVYFADTNEPAGANIVTDANGNYSIDLEPGNYFLKLYKQSYNSIPPVGFAPLAFTITTALETESNYEMQKSDITDGGVIIGKVSVGTTPVEGALVIATSGNTGFSSVSDNQGMYYIYNVPAGSYSVKAWKSTYNSNEITSIVLANTETIDQNLTLTQDASGIVSGMVSFLATSNGEVDVTLVNPTTNEPIPGLSVMTTTGAYEISNVPNGTYIARASYANDTYVVDPDWILKNGDPEVTVNADQIDLPFSVTGAVKLSSPTNASTSTQPVEIAETAPVFTWLAYSSSSDYIIEVSDVNGNIIWGGFTKSAGTITKNIVIPSSQKSIAFNSDGKATIAALIPGKIYRWKIYASKDDQSVTGWKLISSSEDQTGLIKIIQ